jgi:adenylate kinase
MLPNRSYTFPVDSILLLGPTGVGKSPLGDVIAQQGLFGRRCHQLDFGSELRDAVTSVDRSIAYTKKELDLIHGVLKRGLLLENEHFPLAEKIIALCLERVNFSKHDLLVLNGIPRHRGQAKDIADMARVHSLIVLDCSADDILYRIRNNVGGDRTERIDDNKELIENKLSIFRERTAPLIDYYVQKGRAIYRIRVSKDMTPSEVYCTVSALAALDPPISLVAKPPE